MNGSIFRMRCVRWSVLCLVAFTACGAAASAASPPTRAGNARTLRRPNVLLFLVDDMGWMDTSVNGSQYYDTPNIDRLAQRAMRFTDAYAAPLCSPTRASILTGKSPLHHGITTPAGHSPPRARELRAKGPANQPWIYPISQTYLEPTEYTLAEALRDAGYRTGHFGKWHLGLTQPHWPERQGFDVAFHAEPSAGPASYFSPYGVLPQGVPGGKTHVGTITDGPPGEYITDRLTDEALAFIVANRDRPFFVNLWHYAVHGPWGFKTNYADAYLGKKDPRGRQGNPIMAAMLKSMDESLGRILDTLDELQLADRTLIVFFSDNGGNDFSNAADPERQKREKKQPPTSDLLKSWRKYAGNLPPTNNAPLRAGKGTIYEGGVRVPLLIAWPGVVRPGSTSSAVVSANDLYPTILDVLQIPPNPTQQMDGVSLVPVLKESGPLPRDGVFTYFPHSLFNIPPGVSVRAGDWKLIRWFETNTEHPLAHELYNLRDDLSETRNRAAEMPEQMKRLNALLDGFLATSDGAPRPNPAYAAAASGRGAAGDPLCGWVAQNCRATPQNGLLHIEATGQPPFLGISRLEHLGPVDLRVYAKGAGGPARAQWRTADQPTFPAGQVVEFTLAASAGGAETHVELPVRGVLLHLRLYLPVQTHPLDLGWVEMRSVPPRAQPQRWVFGGTDKK